MFFCLKFAKYYVKEYILTLAVGVSSFPTYQNKKEMISEPLHLRINLWLENDDGQFFFGMGRYVLLEQVNECGSLKQAAETLGMSYRAAWGKMKQAEEMLGAPLIEKHGSNRAGYKLTQLGYDLMIRYKNWLKDVEVFALEKAKEHMGWSVLPYKKRPCYK